MTLLRRLLGETLRGERQRQGRTLRDVSAESGVSLGYLSEVERGRKEASSECLAAICSALGAPLSGVLLDVSAALAVEEARDLGVAALPVASAPVHAVPAGVQDLAA